MKTLGRFISSLRNDIVAGSAGQTYHTWHFDGLSDDGREAVVITFHDNYVLSPRYSSESKDVKLGTPRPAVSFVFARDGKPVVATAVELERERLTIDAENIECRIGRSFFHVERAAYGSGFVVHIDLPRPGGRRVRGDLEWLFVEADLLPPTPEGGSTASWNIVTPRADVSGRIDLVGWTGRVRATHHFRGTGYHDSVTNRGPRDRSPRVWGRAHFTDSTVVFEMRGPIDAEVSDGMFIVIRDGVLTEHAARFVSGEHRRDRWGLNVPRRLDYEVDTATGIAIRPRSLIRSGVYEVKTLSDITVTLGDGSSRTVVGLTDFIDPSRDVNRIARALDGLRVKKKETRTWI